MRSFVLVVGLLAGSVASAATPSEGVALQVRRGFFTETDIGMFFTLGGQSGYSNAQTYLQLGAGYDVSEHIELGLHVGIGANSQNCFAVSEPGESCEIRSGPRDVVSYPDNFTFMYLDGTAAYLFKLMDRFYIAPKLFAGYTLLDPAPLADEAGALISSGPNVGVGVGVEYATNMDHFSIGADATVRYVIGPNIPTIAIFPRVKYTF
ncbi:MAG: adventurous gliding motility protein CglE [Myxococcaceae bacterium]|nr:adventurous gliding motility protein CglE [Myxococcaceae bacterium]